MMSDVNMDESFRRKARFFADGNKTKTPASMTYSSVVSRDSVWIAFPIEVLNVLDVFSCDIQNAYFTVDCKEQVRVADGPKFGSEAGNNMLVRKALCVLKSSGAAFRSFLADTLDAMVYRPSYTKPDL